MFQRKVNKKFFQRDNVVDPWEMEQSTKLNEKQATAAVKVVNN